MVPSGHCLWYWQGEGAPVCSFQVYRKLAELRPCNVALLYPPQMCISTLSGSTCIRHAHSFLSPSRHSSCDSPHRLSSSPILSTQKCLLGKICSGLHLAIHSRWSLEPCALNSIRRSAPHLSHSLLQKTLNHNRTTPRLCTTSCHKGFESPHRRRDCARRGFLGHHA